MRRRRYSLLAALVLASCRSVAPPVVIPKAEEVRESEAVAPVPPAPQTMVFVTATWTPHPDPSVKGYNLYLGQVPGVLYSPIKLDLQYHLHGVCEQRILFMVPKIYVGVSAYNDAGESPMCGPVEYPPPVP